MYNYMYIITNVTDFSLIGNEAILLNSFLFNILFSRIFTFCFSHFIWTFANKCLKGTKHLAEYFPSVASPFIQALRSCVTLELVGASSTPIFRHDGFLAIVIFSCFLSKILISARPSKSFY